MQGNGTSSNIHGKQWVGTEVHDQALAMYTAQDNRIPKGSQKLIDKLIAYVLQARRLRVKFSYSDSDIIAMDETAVWQDMLSNTTVDSIGHNTIAMKRTGHEKTKVSVCLNSSLLSSFPVLREKPNYSMKNSRLNVL